MMKPQLDRAKRGFANVASRIPYVRDKLFKKNSWENLDGSTRGRFTEKRLSSSTMASVAGRVPPGNSRLEPITVQTTFTRRSSIASQYKNAAAVGGTVSSVGVSTMGVSTLGISQAGDMAALAPPAPTAGPPGLSPFADPSDMEATQSAQPLAQRASLARQLVGTNHGPKPSLSSITPQYNLTLLSAMASGGGGGGGPRMSDLSSLSSGFGDGDIVVPRQARKSTTGASKLQNVTSTADLEQRGTSRHSTATTMTTTESGSARRDTVYTEASEDSPPRFRTVSAWVRQQSGRVKREKQREQDAADESGNPPPVPAIPPEQEFRLMMPDGQVPRPVEDTNANQTKGSPPGGVTGAAS